MHATILKGIVGDFKCTVFQRNLKESYGRPLIYVCECWRKVTKVGSTATVVRNSVLIISHITFRDCRVHFILDKLSRNSCILVWIVPFAYYVRRGQSKPRLIFSRINGPIVAWCCDLRWMGWPNARNISQQGGQTYTTCCAQQCCKMLRWNVASVWPGLNTSVGTTLVSTLWCFESLGEHWTKELDLTLVFPP